LKLTHVLHWSWWVTLIPAYLIGLDIVFSVVMLVVAFIVVAKSRSIIDKATRDFHDHGKVRYRK
jgi:hypothetical protein